MVHPRGLPRMQAALAVLSPEVLKTGRVTTGPAETLHFLTPEGEEEYGQTPQDVPSSSSDFSSPLAGEVGTPEIYATHVDTIHLSLPGYFRDCVIKALTGAKERARHSGASIVRSGPWAFEVQRIGARPFFDFLLIGPWATVKINPRGGDVAAFVELRSKALAALGPHAVGREIQLMVSRWTEGQLGDKQPVRVGRYDVAVNFNRALLGLDGGQLSHFVTRSRARVTWAAAEPVSWPRCRLKDSTRARAIEAIEGAETIEAARKAVFRVLTAPGCTMRTTFEGVQEEHLLDAIFHRGRGFTGHAFAMGADVSARLYDKTIEARKRRTTWILNWLKDGGWDGETSVHRLEFQLRGRALRQFVSEQTSLRSRDLGPVLDATDGIWGALTGRESEGRKRGWITLRTPGASPQPTRWPVHPGWEEIQNARWFAKRPKAERFNRDYIPAALRGGFRRSPPIVGAAEALSGPMRGQVAEKRRQLAAQIQGLAAAYVAAEVAEGLIAEPETPAAAESEILRAMSQIGTRVDDPAAKVRDSIDLTYFRTAHSLLEEPK